MDQTHDIAYYFDRGLQMGSKGAVRYIVEPHRNLAAISGWGKDEPFTAIIFIGFPTEVDRSIPELRVWRKLLADLEEKFLTEPPVRWEHP